MQKDEKIEHCVELTLRKTTIGLLSSIIPAVLIRMSFLTDSTLKFDRMTCDNVCLCLYPGPLVLTSSLPFFFWSSCTGNNYGRVAALALGTGIGFGMGYTECRLLYEKNISFQKKYIATIQVNDDESK